MSRLRRTERAGCPRCLKVWGRAKDDDERSRPRWGRQASCSCRLHHRTFQKWLASFLCFSICLSVVGCSHEWRKKFIRKRQKEVQPPQAILTLQPDYKAMVPAADRYREHFAFWKSWHGELLSSLGQIQKRDVRYLNGVIGELRAMISLLTGEPAQRLREILTELQEMEDKWSSAPSTWSIPISQRTTLERLQRGIDKAFYYSRVKEFLVKDPEAVVDEHEKPKK